MPRTKSPAKKPDEFTRGIWHAIELIISSLSDDAYWSACKTILRAAGMSRAECEACRKISGYDWRRCKEMLDEVFPA